MKLSDSDLRRHCERRLGALDRERQSWFAHWRELSDFILPRRGQFLGLPGQSDRGRKANGKILDSTGTLAARTLASGLMSGVTSPARPWFRLTVSDPALAQVAGVRTWLDQVQESMLRVFARSNLYNALATVYEELGVFGTGALLVLEDEHDVVRAWPLTVGEYWLASSDRQVVNTLYREFPITVFQLVERFGRDAVSQHVREQYDAGIWDREYAIVHAIEPNEGRDLARADNRNMPFRSVYYEKAGVDDRLLSVSGFENFPAMCPRWHLVGNDVWGRSPGMDALPDVKGLQTMHKRFSQALEKLINPPMVAPPSLRNETASSLSGAVTYVADSTGVGFRPAYQINPPINHLTSAIADRQRSVQAAFYADLFLMMSQLDDVRSATEIIERREEKLVMLGPVLERLHDELLDPLINRVFGLMERAGAVPPPPEALSGQAMDVEYVSSLAQAQRAVATGGIERFVSFAGRAAAMRPDVLDKLDVDQAVDVYGDLLGVPGRLIVPTEQATAARAQRMQAQQQQAALQAGQTLAIGAERLGRVDVGGGKNALQALLGR
ncbi:MAG: hypothetical protein IBJ17_02855 [Reyranella sp.]|nr:hypothetical protein [Reyranella sp.]